MFFILKISARGVEKMDETAVDQLSDIFLKTTDAN